jgi:hypothetical protein
MPGITVNENGTLKNVLGLHVNDAGTVKPVLEGYVNESGTIKKFWPSVGPPSAVNNLAVTGSSGATLDVAWSLPFDGGSPITDQVIEWGTDGVSFPNSASVGAVATTYTITGLAALTIYYIRHKSTNANGTSPYSNIAQGETLAANFPQAPTLLNTSNSGSGILTVTADITQGGGGVPTQYELQYAPYPYTSFSAAGTIPRTGATTPASFTVPNHATAYAMRARAINGTGTSSWSNLAYGVSPGPMVNGTSFNPQQDPYDTGSFPDIVYAKNDVANGGNGQVIGSVSPTSVNGLTVERLGRPGQNVATIELIGASVSQANFKWLTIGNQSSAYSFTLDSAAAEFTPGLGTAGTVNRWRWPNVPTEYISEIFAGAGLSWWVGGPT